MTYSDCQDKAFEISLSQSTNVTLTWHKAAISDGLFRVIQIADKLSSIGTNKTEGKELIAEYKGVRMMLGYLGVDSNIIGKSFTDHLTLAAIVKHNIQ